MELEEREINSTKKYNAAVCLTVRCIVLYFRLKGESYFPVGLALTAQKNNIRY